MFSPRCSAAPNSSSIAAAKCDPNTSALVVPAASSPSRNSAATARAYAWSASLLSSGSAHRSSQSSSGMPSPPIARICGKWTWVSTKPGTSIPPASRVTGSSGCSARSAAKRAPGADDAVPDQQRAVLGQRVGRVAGERVARRVDDRSPA